MEVIGGNKLFLNNGKECVLVGVMEIVRCESNGNSTTFYFDSMESFTVSKTIKEYDYILSSLGFLRPHQSHLVNKIRIRRFYKGEELKLLMDNGDLVPVSQRRKEMVVRSMKNNQTKEIESA